MNRSTDNARSISYGGEQSLASDIRLRPGEEPPLAAHLVTPRALYNHHGIYIGNGRVIHCSGFAHGLQRAPVEDVSLEDFARGRGIRVRHEAPKFDHCQAVERARSRLGECRYRLLTNNCEHFCSWALRDESCSRQVERLRVLLHIVRSVIRATIDRATPLPIATYPATPSCNRPVYEPALG